VINGDEREFHAIPPTWVAMLTSCFQACIYWSMLASASLSMQIAQVVPPQRERRGC
jgi:hypothetical protein